MDPSKSCCGGAPHAFDSDLVSLSINANQQSESVEKQVQTDETPSDSTMKPRWENKPQKKDKISNNKNDQKPKVKYDRFSGADKKKTKELPNCQFEYFDSHCHLDAVLVEIGKKLEKKAEKALVSSEGKEDAQGKKNEEKKEACGPSMQEFASANFLGNFGGCVTVCCEDESYDSVMKILDNDSSNKIYGAFGLHPHNAKDYTDEIEKRLESAMSHPKTVAWGECGLDFYYDLSDRELQKKVFMRQMELCIKHKKPLVVHSRNAEEDTVDLMTKIMPKDWKIHLHCCTSSMKMVKPLLDYFSNLYVGFTGCITFPKADDVRETLRGVPIERLLLETDAPYMAPLPFRGDIAHPGMIPLTAERMAAEKNVSMETLLKHVRENVKAVYGI